MDAGDAGVATLDIPPAFDDRVFEVSCSLEVRRHRDADEAGGESPWHQLTLQVDGRHQWSRRVATEPGLGDGLDYRCRLRVPAADGVRLVAIAATHGARRLRLRLSAEEERHEA